MRLHLGSAWCGAFARSQCDTCSSCSRKQRQCARTQLLPRPGQQLALHHGLPADWPCAPYCLGPVPCSQRCNQCLREVQRIDVGALIAAFCAGSLDCFLHPSSRQRFSWIMCGPCIHRPKNRLSERPLVIANAARAAQKRCF